MKYNKSIGLKGNLFLIKNKIKNKIFKNEFSYSDNIRKLKYKPIVNIVVNGNVNINQNYENIVVTRGAFASDAEYVCFINNDYVLLENTVYNMVAALQNEKYDVVYSDECVNGRDFFKPDWSPDTLKSFDYIGLALIKKSLADENRDCYSNLIMIADRKISVYHISKILYKSRREINGNDRILNSVNDKISIIIPSKDNYAVLKRCIDSIRNKSNYKNYEIIVVDNGSAEPEKYEKLADKYIYEKDDFNFSKMCNTGAESADGAYFLFLNDDTEVISENWLEILAGYADEKNIGAVGAKLYYPNSDIIQHCGVINIYSGPVHYLIGMNDNEDIYFGRNRYTYNVSAVTAACMMIKKDKFNGFDEDFKVGYNDVDLCLGLIEKGYNNVVLNNIKLYHYESLSRGDDKADISKLKRLALEKKRLYKKHREFCCNDRFYNVNLTQYRADFSLGNNKILIPKKINTDIKSNIEYVEEYSYFRDGIWYIGGYVKSVKKCSVYIFIGNKAVKAERDLRQDISALYGKDYVLSGFSARIFTGEKYEYKIVAVE